MELLIAIAVIWILYYVAKGLFMGESKSTPEQLRVIRNQSAARQGTHADGSSHTVSRPHVAAGIEPLPDEAYPDDLLPATEDDELNFEYEAFAAKDHWRVWIRYEDASGNESERKIDIHAAQEDNYIFAWCCLKNGPRTFRRDRILEFKILNEHFEFKPALERWFREEYPQGDQMIPWERFKEMYRG